MEGNENHYFRIVQSIRIMSFDQAGHKLGIGGYQMLPWRVWDFIWASLLSVCFVESLCRALGFRQMKLCCYFVGIKSLE